MKRWLKSLKDWLTAGLNPQKRINDRHEADVNNVVAHAGMHRVLQVAGVLVSILLCYATYRIALEFLNDYVYPYPLAATIGLLYLYSSIRVVREFEVGATFFYGMTLDVLGSGPHFIPLGLMQLVTGPRYISEFQCPGEPEQVQKNDDKKPLEAGKVRPIRIVTGRTHEKTKGDLLDARMTLDINFYVQWVISNVLQYASKFGNKAEVEKQVRDIAEALLAEIAVGHSAASFIDHLEQINQHLKDKLEERLMNFGVHIIAVRLVSPDISHDLSSELRNIPIARAKAEQTVQLAEAEKKKRTKEGEGDAGARLAMLRAEAKGRKANMEALGVSGEAILAAETATSILSKTDVIVAGAEGGMKDMMGLVKGAQSALKPKETQP